MRARIVAVVVVTATAAAVVVVMAAASTTANGLPSYTNGYQTWPRLNKKPIRNDDPRSGHAGLKNVYTSKRKVGAKYPNGTVIVKSIAEPPRKHIAKVAVMRKVDGRWQWVEYVRSSGKRRYSVLARGQLCVSCHVQVRSNDWVFTKR
jgi:aspartokinase